MIPAVIDLLFVIGYLLLHWLLVIELLGLSYWIEPMGSAIGDRTLNSQ
jgi:hypothetical protein